MADCVSLLDEELSSFVFNYLTENSGSPYGEEEEVCSDPLDTDFPDFDLSQLDASDFDSVNCLGELHWCNDQANSSPASIQYSVGDAELFETEEENAALLAALTDSLDGIVEDGVGGLSVFPSLGEDPEEEEEEEDDLLLDSEPAPGLLSPETEDPSLLKKLLLTPPNGLTSLDINKVSSVLSKTQQIKPVWSHPKRDRTSASERKPRAFRPAGHLCTELHRHLTQEPNTEDTPSADTEEEEEEDEEDEDSDSEDEGEEEEEEESSSCSEVESTVCAEPPEPQFPSEKERNSVVELIRYMHTYCVPMRKQASWDRKERENQARRAKAEHPAVPRNATPTISKLATTSASTATTSVVTKPRNPFARRRETKTHSLLKELLEAVALFDVSKPYRLHSPPYSHSRGAAGGPKSEHKDMSVTESSHADSKRPKSSDPDEGSFSVRRSRRLASFPSRFAKRSRMSGRSAEDESSVRQLRVDSPVEESNLNVRKSPETSTPCCNNEKRARLCLPLTSKSTGDTQYPSRPFEQTLCVELCGTAGLTPPTTPPHKPVEEELFKPEGKTELPGKGFCPVRTHLRKLPEQTELYAQLQRMGPTSEVETKRGYGDHDYCLLNLGESHKRIAAILPASVCHTKMEETEVEIGEKDRQKEMLAMREAAQQVDLSPDLSPRPPEEPGQPSPACSPMPEADESQDSCHPPSPCHQLNSSCESHHDQQSNNITHGKDEDGDKCQVLYIHNLPSSVTQAVLRKRFEAFGEPDDCRVLIKNEERCGIITFRQTQNEVNQKHRRDFMGQHGGNGRRFSRKRYIDLDEAGPGPVKSKYDALDFDTLLKEAQRSLQR